MANLAKTAVTILEAWTEGGTNGKRLTVVKCQMVLTGQGSTTNTIPASVLGLSLIKSSTLAVVSDNSKVYPTAPSADETLLLITDPTTVTDANRANPSDVTATVIVTVKGLP